jgi:hypothetical protein
MSRVFTRTVAVRVSPKSLPTKDSNLDKLAQNQSCCRYTSGQ